MKLFSSTQVDEFLAYSVSNQACAMGFKCETHGEYEIIADATLQKVEALFYNQINRIGRAVLDEGKTSYTVTVDMDDGDEVLARLCMLIQAATTSPISSPVSTTAKQNDNK